MPAITRRQFQRIIQMQVEKVKAIIIADHADSPLIIGRYPNGVDFNNDEYMAALSEIYPDTRDIPDVFMNVPHRHIDVDLSKSLTTSYALEICSIEDQLNSVDSSHLTNFSLENSSNLRFRGRVLDITLILEDNPSIFMQLSTSPAAILGLTLLLIGACLLSATTLGTVVVGATAVVGSIALISSAFFATKKPGINGGFSLEPLPETIDEDLMNEAQANIFA